MSFRDFPRLKGPPPLLWAGAMLAVSLGAISFYPGAGLFLSLNLLNILLILLIVILGQGVMPRLEKNFILVVVLFLVLGLYGFYRGFEKAPFYLIEIFEVLPALVFFFALRLYRAHYAIKKALAMTRGLIPEERLDFADKARTKFKKYPGALQAAANIYKEVAEEGLSSYYEVLPIHIVAMQKYGHMLIYDEARGRPGEGEWYAKKAHDLSLAMLEDSDIPPTIH